jgi:inner membrane protein
MVSHISRNFPQQWLGSTQDKQLHRSVIGVDFILPVDSYRMTERSSKYVVLFLLLTFAAIWLIEVLTNIRVHVLQYLFIGLSMCLFYLLLLAFSEHVGFSWAYLIASVAIIALCSGYARAILKTKRNALIIGGSISTLYLYLFTLLHEQNYSLMLGSVGVLVSLAIVMYSTRNIDWFKLVDTDKEDKND